MSDVFISYSRKDTDFVRRIFDNLNARGREAWVDWQGIDYSTKWWEEICAGIEGADNFVLILSPDSLNSVYCHREIEHARKHNKRIIPFIYRPWDEKSLVGGWYTVPEMRPHEPMARQNWDALKAIQYIDYPGKLKADFDRSMAALLATVDTDPERVRLHTRLILRIRDWAARGRSPSALLRGDELSAYESWLTKTDSANDEPRATDDQRAYIAESHRVEDEETRQDALRERRIRQFRGAAFVLGIVGLVAVVATVMSIVQVVAGEQRLNVVATQVWVGETRIESLGLAAQSSNVLQEAGGNVETAVLLGIRALQTLYSPQADAALVRALDRLYTRHIFIDIDTPSSPSFTAVTQVAFSSDGRYILTGDRNNKARLWDIQTGALLRQFSHHATNGVKLRVAFTPDGRYVLTGDESGSVQIWNAETGESVPSFVTTSTYTLNDPADLFSIFSADGRYVLSIAQDGLTELWSTETGEKVRHLPGFSISQTSVNSLALSADGRYMLTSDYDGMAELWKADTGEKIRRFLDKTDTTYYPPFDPAFSPDGHYVISSGGDGTARLWDTETGAQLRQFGELGSDIRGVAFSPDGRYVLIGIYPTLLTNTDYTARLFDAETGAEVRKLSGSTSGIESVAFSPDGRYVLTGDRDGTARLWDVRIEDHLRQFNGNTGRIEGVAFSPNGRYVLTGNDFGDVRLWDATTREEVREYVGHIASVHDVAFSPDGRYVLTGSGDLIGMGHSVDATVRLWDTETGKEVRQFIGDNLINDVTFNSDGRYVLAGTNYGEVRLWDTLTGNILHELVDPSSSVSSVAFSPDDRYILVSRLESSYAARMWDFELKAEVRQFNNHTGFVTSVAFSPDGHYVLTGSADFTARLWDAETGAEVRQFIGHTSAVTSVAFSPDGHYVLTGSADFTARLWDAETGAEVRQFIGHTNALTSVAFSPDGRYIITGSADQTLRFWDVSYLDFITYACARLFRDFLPKERIQFSLDDSPTCPQFAATPAPTS